MKIVRQIFEMALKRIGCKQIAMTLKRKGFLTGKGQRWGKTTVHKILNNEAYCGTLVFGGRLSHQAIRSGEPPVRVENRLSRLYDALETGKLNIGDLSPRIKELRMKQDELSKIRVVAEAEMTLKGYQQLDIDNVRSYVNDLANLLEESEVIQRKGFRYRVPQKTLLKKSI